MWDALIRDLRKPPGVCAQPDVHAGRLCSRSPSARRDDRRVQRRRRRAAETARVSRARRARRRVARRAGCAGPHGRGRRIADVAVDDGDLSGRKPVVRASRLLGGAKRQCHGLRQPEQVQAVLVTSQTLAAFGVPPLLGRWVGLEDEIRTARPSRCSRTAIGRSVSAAIPPSSASASRPWPSAPRSSASCRGASSSATSRRISSRRFASTGRS